MVNICQKFKLNVTGFQRNLNNAPKKTLESTIKIALTNGLQKKKGRKTSDHLQIEDMLTELTNDAIKKCPYIEHSLFIDFAHQAEIDSNIKTYETIAVVYQLYPEEYNTYYKHMVENTKQQNYLFFGITEDLKQTSFEKILRVVEKNTHKDRNYKLLEELQNNFLKSNEKEVVERYEQLINTIKDEDDLFLALSKSAENLHYLLIIAFLLQGDNYQKTKYSSLLQYVLFEIQTKKLVEVKDDLNTKELELEKYEEENLIIKEKIEKLEQENSELTITLDNQKIQYNKIYKELLEIKENKQQLETILQQNEPLQMMFLRIASEYDFLIITKDVDEFRNTPFEGVTISPSEFKRSLKNNPNNRYKEQILFITRTSFQTAKDWYQFKQHLENKNLKYEELGQYDICCYIQGIIEHLCRKEVLIYADEL